MAYQSHIARTALRKALRTHPNADSFLQGRLVSSLTLSELHDGLLALGIDAVALMKAINADILASNTAPNSEPSINAAPDPNDDDDLDIGEDEAETMDNRAAETAAIEAEVQTIRGLIVTGGFGSLDDRLRQLVTEARKPAVEIRIEVPVDVTPGAPVHTAKPTGKSETWRNLFNVKGGLGKRETALWDGSHPNTPRINPEYVWPQPQTATILSQISRGRNVLLFGPAGTGKTELAQQIAARTGRPFALISCDNGTDAATLVGMTVPDAAGGVSWQDGQLTRAIRTPGCVVCLDEPSVARPGALFVLQNVLANRVLYVSETGARIPVASGVIFLATDNTNGTGGGARKGYTDTNRLNAAFLDRFGVRVKIDYLPKAAEIAVLVAYTGCTPELADLLVTGAAVTRAAADDQTLSHGIGLRRLLSWAELLTDGIDPETAFKSAVLDCAAEQDVETLREQLLLTYNTANVKAALNPVSVVTAPAPTSDPSLTNPTPAGRNAASDFSQI